MHYEYTKRQVCLMGQLRKLWTQHVYWTRFFIISTAADLGDLIPVTNRLLRNPDDFAQLLMPCYGKDIAQGFSNLLRDHLLIAADLVNAAKKQNSAQIAEAQKKWYENADQIALFLATINPFWNREKWQDMLYNHLQMTEKEALLRLSGSYEEDIKVFDMIEIQALEMADYMFYGMVEQFCFD